LTNQSVEVRMKATADGGDVARGASRREFLHYVWGASMALALAAGGSAAYVFALPRLRGLFARVPVHALPAIGAAPLFLTIDSIRVWITQTETGIHVFDGRCTHSGCYFPWSGEANVFACPCHGSQFERDGAWYAGPAPRALDRYPVQWRDADGNALTPVTVDPLPMRADASNLVIRVEQRVFSAPHP
jgi:cytochrome b6-f complex iron-sulfur subunit